MGFKLMDGGPNCVADDILAAVVKQLDRVGLLLHPETANGHLRMRPNLPRPLRPHQGVILQDLPRDGREKWLRSMLTSRGSKLHHVGPNGGHNLMMLATIFKTEGFRYWICVLLMMSLFLQNLMRKSVMY